MNVYSFQICPKLVIFSADKKRVLLACRKGEKDYNAVYSFIGGKLETGDENMLEGIRREKTQEIGVLARIKVAPQSSCYYLLFTKSDGVRMFLPYFISIYKGGEIQLNLEEYSEYRWIEIEGLASFKQKAPGVDQAVGCALKQLPTLEEDEFVVI